MNAAPATAPEGESRFYSSQDGLKLHARIYGDRDAGPVIVCLPGLTRNARDFDPVARLLTGDPAQPRRVIAFDYRGRGRSAHDPDWRNYQVPVEAGDIVAGLDAFGVQKAVFVGTSRGGLIVFALAAMRPSLIAGVVLNDIGPVLEGAGLALIRAYLDGALKAKTLDEAIAIYREAQGKAFPALDDADWRRMVSAGSREDGGTSRPDFDPALLKTLHGIDFSRPLPVFWPQFAGLAKVPLLAIRGENSKLFSDATLREMAKRHPGCATLTVPGQGHPPLLETGDLPGTLARFCDKSWRLAA